MVKGVKKESAVPTILLIEDDQQLSSLLSQQLQDEGYRVICASDGVRGHTLVQQHEPDLVLLDIIMPRMDGWETCRQIRQCSDVPIIIVSCRGAELDRVRGLELGADDYVTKPISYPELTARIRAGLRRGNRPLLKTQMTVVDDRLAIDSALREALVDGQSIPLSAVEYKLLKCFVDHRGRLLTHRSLLIQVWGWEYIQERHYLKVYVHRLRKKIEQDPTNPHYIQTERGLGYRFRVP
jgi:two-component system KDP operon response regulator KdpE